MELEITTNLEEGEKLLAKDMKAADLPFALYSAWLSMHKLSSTLLNQLGLTYPQYLVLSVLRGREPTSVSKIGELVYLESSTTSPILKRLQQEGLLSRKRDSLDERVVLVELSDEGLTILDEAERQLKRLPTIIDFAQNDSAHLLQKLDALRAKLVKVRSATPRARRRKSE